MHFPPAVLIMDVQALSVRTDGISSLACRLAKAITRRQARVISASLLPIIIFLVLFCCFSLKKKKKMREKEISQRKLESHHVWNRPKKNTNTKIFLPPCFPSSRFEFISDWSLPENSTVPRSLPKPSPYSSCNKERNPSTV